MSESATAAATGPTAEERLAEALRRAGELATELQATKILLQDEQRLCALATTERDALQLRLQDLRALLARRPASPTRLLEAYMAWTGEVQAFESTNPITTAAQQGAPQ